MKQEVRIIGGLFRGKKIHFDPVDGLRPTSSRVRETLFNWLMHDIHDTHCLDVFAGSGALGFEAYSRGAASVTFIEHNATAAKCLAKTIKTLPSSQLRLIQQDALTYLQGSNEQFDIIFLDPPFAHSLIPQCLQLIASKKLLRTGGLVYLESAHMDTIDTSCWHELKSKKAGQVIYRLIQRISY